MSGYEWGIWAVAMVALLGLGLDLWLDVRRRRAAQAAAGVARLRTAVRDPEAYAVPVMSEALRQALANFPQQTRTAGEHDAR